MDKTHTSILQASALELEEKMAAGSLNSVVISEAFLDQIDRHSQCGLQLKAVISVAPREKVLARARILDEERSAGTLRSRLHGVPIIVKDAIVTDASLGMPTTVGSHVFAALKAKRNATLIDKVLFYILPAYTLNIFFRANRNGILRTKARKLLGDLRTHKAHRSRSNEPIGWSSYMGQTLSPYRRPGFSEVEQPSSEVPGGSSSGSAVSVAAGFCPVAIGIETVTNLHPSRPRTTVMAPRPRVSRRVLFRRAHARSHANARYLTLPLAGILEHLRRTEEQQKEHLHRIEEQQKDLATELRFFQVVIRAEINNAKSEISSGVTKDISCFRQDVTKDISCLRQDVTKDISCLRQEVTKDIDCLRQEVTKDIACLRQDVTKDIGCLRQDVTKELSTTKTDLQEYVVKEITVRNATLFKMVIGGFCTAFAGYIGHALITPAPVATEQEGKTNDPEPEEEMRTSSGSWTRERGGLVIQRYWLEKGHQRLMLFQCACNSRMTEDIRLAAVAALRTLAGSEGIGKVMTEHDLDIVLAPSDSTLVSFAACSGWPIATVPLGRLVKNGQPYGFFAVSRDGREDVLFRFMAAYHKTFPSVARPSAPF
ncbi:amidase signature enzyme [Coniochaeta ligniaria NRRL 30616]|uniref:Amidase signature enzyme n=1 Tax=Coniochaeta ligniaria NRRL 30616 TaxID=1408157 RepID=A0A1J7JCQ4_9PEZI|nr:amidase signature enzyme [Coniochaeta ligniaria NRRL 30616]